MGVNSVPSTVSPCSTHAHCLPVVSGPKCVCVCIPPLLHALAEMSSSAWGSVHLEVMRTSFSIGWSVMHCHLFVQVQRLQAVPTPPLAQTMAFQTQREGSLTQLVRCLQHHAEVDGLVGICMYVCTCHVCPRVCGG